MFLLTILAQDMQKNTTEFLKIIQYLNAADDHLLTGNVVEDFICKKHSTDTLSREKYSNFKTILLL